MRDQLLIICTSFLLACGGSTASEDAALSDAALSDAALSDAALSDAALSDAASTDAVIIDAPTVLVISPPSAEVLVIDGASAPVSFTVMAGSIDVTAQATWSVDSDAIGAVAAGVFTATGTVAGPTMVRASWNGGTAEATVGVTLTTVIDPGGAAAGFIDGSIPEASVSIWYPSDGVVMPRNVAAPEVQWLGGSPGDTYRIILREQFAEATIYGTSAPPDRLVIPDAAWSLITNSGRGAQSDPVSLIFQRSGYAAIARTLHLAQGDLPGFVYSDAVPSTCGSSVEIQRQKVSSVTSETLPISAGSGCVSCHSVSRDGRTVAVTIDTASPFPLTTFDVPSSSFVGLVPGGTPVGGTFSSFNRAGDKLVYSTDGTGVDEKLRIIDSTTGTVLNDDAMGVGCGEPVWSPDGNRIAAVCAMASDGNWMFDSTAGNLAIATVSADGYSTQDVTTLVPQAGLAGRPSYPTFSPDSLYLAFSDTTAGSRSTANGTLYVVGADGTGLTPLTLAAPDNLAMYPTFATTRAGGYYWVAFATRRNYGNRLVGQNIPQIWITAIDEDPTSGGDPSHPAFYLRGQSTCQNQEGLHFANPECGDNADTCATGRDCCSGHCEVGVCVAASVCAADFNACTDASDCCEASSTCLDEYCTPPFAL
jgi:hypothetical protein